MEINCVGAGSCSAFFYTTDSDVSITCDNGPESDNSYKHGACHYMQFGETSMADLPDIVARGGRCDTLIFESFQYLIHVHAF